MTRIEHAAHRLPVSPAAPNRRRGHLLRRVYRSAVTDGGRLPGLLAQRDYELFLFKRGHVSPDTAMARSMLGLPP